MRTHRQFGVGRDGDVANRKPHFGGWEELAANVLLERLSVEEERDRADVPLSFTRREFRDIFVLVNRRLLWWIHVETWHHSRCPIAQYQAALALQRLVSAFDSGVRLKGLWRLMTHWSLISIKALTPVGNSSKAITVNTTNVPLKILSGSETFPLMSRL